jgi:hypothetical protein
MMPVFARVAVGACAVRRLLGAGGGGAQGDEGEGGEKQSSGPEHDPGIPSGSLAGQQCA